MNKKDENKYMIYENDLKFKFLRNLDPDKILWESKELEQKYYNENLDTIEYRYKECLTKNNGEYLDLSHLSLKVIPLIPRNICDSIKYLFINNNELNELNNINQFNKLQVLDISNNYIKNITYLPNTLLELSCRYNEIQNLPFINNLKILDCTSNNIINILHYPNLEILICSDNNIVNIPKYKLLKKLICKNNNIININHYEYLIYLDCSFNKINNIGNCPQLCDLLCRNNLLDALSKDLYNLKYLDIHDNNLETLEYYPNLKELYCNTASIKKVSSKYEVLKSNVYDKNKCFILFK